VRVKYTRERLDTSFTDAYRQWDLAAEVDYDNKFGQITRVGVRDSMLYIIQEKAVNLLYMNDRVLVGDGAGGSLVLGEGEVLATKFQNLSEEYGSQHQWSVIKGHSGDYFYDHGSRTICRIGGGKVEPISITKRFRRDVYDIAEVLGPESDVIHVFADAPVCTGGVVGWRDKRQSDVGFTFIVPGDEACPYTLRTLVFDEYRDVYMGKRTHHSPFYLRINNDFYSLNPAAAPWNTDEPFSQFFLHDSNTVGRTVFYAAAPRSMVNYSVNPMPGVAKVFDSAALFASPVAPDSVTVYTKSQRSAMTPFMSVDPWKAPAYKEGAWWMAFLRADTVIAGQDQGVDSYIRGEWMLVETRWASGLDLEVATAVTQYRPSYS